MAFNPAHVLSRRDPRCKSRGGAREPIATAEVVASIVWQDHRVPRDYQSRDERAATREDRVIRPGSRFERMPCAPMARMRRFLRAPHLASKVHVGQTHRPARDRSAVWMLVARQAFPSVSR